MGPRGPRGRAVQVSKWPTTPWRTSTHCPLRICFQGLWSLPSILPTLPIVFFSFSSATRTRRSQRPPLLCLCLLHGAPSPSSVVCGQQLPCVTVHCPIPANPTPHPWYGPPPPLGVPEGPLRAGCTQPEFSEAQKRRRKLHPLKTHEGTVLSPLAFPRSPGLTLQTQARRPRMPLGLDRRALSFQMPSSKRCRTTMLERGVYLIYYRDRGRSAQGWAAVVSWIHFR